LTKANYKDIDQDKKKGHRPVLEFLNNLWGARNRVGIGLSYQPAMPGYIGWQNWFLGIDSWAPSKFENSDSGYIGWRNCFLGIDYRAPLKV
jgi:hypothetical protein